jgi:outer membrane receptor protein involved in Fe transport
MQSAGAVTLDDTLRQVPGFSLFRRSGSLTANPTSQGVSLRGVGANGASRAVVLLDGVPLNSPFGGWVYWDRVPRADIDSVQVTNGATSDVYGSGALGGVIDLQTRQVEQPFFETDLSFGNKDTVTGSASGGILVSGWSVNASAQALRTGGYILVSRDERGAVDTPAGTADLTGSLTLARALRDGRFFLRVTSFGESRRNGTPVQINDTRIASADLGFDRTLTAIGHLSARFYGSREIFNQNFSAVSTDRNSESLTNRQRNPSQQLGFAVQWLRSIAGRHVVVAGIEGRDVRGHSAEATFNAARLTANLDAGGRQRILGVFGQGSLHAAEWNLTIGGRIDRWLDYDGFLNRTPVTGPRSFSLFTDRAETAFSPRISVSRRLGNTVSIGASLYRAFRAPTLNELYRSFRVGNVVTNANADLRAERLTGGEAGMTLRKFSDRFTMRANFFWSEIRDPIANVTLSATPTLITRQRQNLGAIRARGFEASSAVTITDRLTLSADYLLTDSSVLRFPPNRALEGLLVPQIPRQQLNFQLAYSHGKWMAGMQARIVGKQFDDDQNLFPLRRYFTIDASLSRALTRQVFLFIAAQNLTGSRFEIGRTPVLTVGPPALVRFGARLEFR